MTPYALIEATAYHYGLKVSDLRGPSRTHRVAYPRQLACWMIRKNTKASLPRIGQLLHRDHTTVMHAVEAVDARMDADLAADIESISDGALLASGVVPFVSRRASRQPIFKTTRKETAE